MNNAIPIFSFGMFVGAGIVAILLTFTPNIFSAGKEALQECEKEIPRNQYCKIVAITQSGIRE